MWYFPYDRTKTNVIVLCQYANVLVSVGLPKACVPTMASILTAVKCGRTWPLKEWVAT